MKKDIRYINTDGNDKDFIILCRELDQFLNQLVGGENNRAEYIPYNQLDDNLEIQAIKQGYKKLILESGEPLIAAMNLYKKLGYQVISNYEPYVDMPESICMEKIMDGCS